MNALPDLGAIIEPIARALLGEPNRRLSSKRELRFGTHGSVAVKLDTGTWYDHENKCGGGALDLIQTRQRTDKSGALQWLRDKGLLPAREAAQQPRIVVTYDYTDAAGAVLFQVERMEPKSFRQRRPNGRGGWEWKGPEHPVLYRLPEVLKAVADRRRIYIAEGEKGVDALRSLGLTATCSPGGAGKWKAEYSDALAGAHVVILPDNDDAGRRHAEQVAASLAGKAKSVHTVALPGLAHKADPFDWIEAGGTVAQLEDMLVAAAAAPEPEKTTTTKTGAGKFQLLDTAALIRLPERGYLFKGIMSPGELSVWWGPPKCGKSFLLLHVAYALAQGRSVFGRRVRKCRVLYIACEGRSGLRARVEALVRRYGHAPDFLAIARPVKLWAADGDTAALRALVAEHRADLVVVDTINRVMAGGDENSSADMGALIRHLDDLRQPANGADHGPHVACIHHGTKAGSNGPRGHGSLLGAVDASIEVSAGEDGSRTAKLDAMKDDPRGALAFRLGVVELGEDEDGDPRTTCTVEEEDGRLDQAVVAGGGLGEQDQGGVGKLGHRVSPSRAPDHQGLLPPGAPPGRGPIAAGRNGVPSPGRGGGGGRRVTRWCRPRSRRAGRSR
jgi:hypothetical protein